MDEPIVVRLLLWRESHCTIFHVWILWRKGTVSMVWSRNWFQFMIYFPVKDKNVVKGNKWQPRFCFGWGIGIEHRLKYFPETERDFYVFNVDEAIWPFSAWESTHLRKFDAIGSSFYVCGGGVHVSSLIAGWAKRRIPLCAQRTEVQSICWEISALELTVSWGCHWSIVYRLHLKRDDKYLFWSYWYMQNTEFSVCVKKK